MSPTVARANLHTIDAWTLAGRPVLNHLCPWLRKLQAAAKDTPTPGITDEGFLAAGDINPIPVRFCPGCGTELEADAA